MPRGLTGNMGKGASEVSAESSGVGLVEGTEEQQAVWGALLDTDKHVIVEAVAGSGKTFTITQYAKREKNSRVGLVAFNKHIAKELEQRMAGQGNVSCMTYHSLGLRTLRGNIRGKVDVDQYKTLGILDHISLPVPEKEQKQVRYRISEMVGFAKTYGLDVGITPDEMERLADRHDVWLEGREEVIYEYVPKILKKSMTQLSTIDYDDMIWLPKILGIMPQQFDVLCVDEYQDTSVTQQWLAVKAGKRVCAVGDPRQAIYAFRGCDGKGFEELRRELGGGKILSFPLTLTRRCPKSHVRLAQTIVPQIRALEDAPEGEIRITKDLDEAVLQMKPGDLVVCRVNAELMGAAYKLLRRGVKAVVRGRDIGKGLVKLIDEAGKGGTLSTMLARAGEISDREEQKFLSLPRGKGAMRAANVRDRYECLCALARGAETVGELKGIVERLFAEVEDGKVKNAVVLGTVHRTKGLEAERVFILRPDLIPHPMAKKDEDLQSEMNLAYVAVTRASRELVFVGKECRLFSGLVGGEKAPDEVNGQGEGQKERGEAPEKENGSRQGSGGVPKAGAKGWDEGEFAGLGEEA